MASDVETRQFVVAPSTMSASQFSVRRIDVPGTLVEPPILPSSADVVVADGVGIHKGERKIQVGEFDLQPGVNAYTDQIDGARRLIREGEKVPEEPFVEPAGLLLGRRVETVDYKRGLWVSEEETGGKLRKVTHG